MWIAESGEYIISAAASSRDIKLFETINLQSTQVVPLAFDEYTFFLDYWNNKQTRALLLELMPNWIKGIVTEGDKAEIREYQGFMVEHPLIKYPYITHGEITHEQVMQLVEKCKDLTFTP